MRVEPFTVALDPPLGTARGAMRERQGFLVGIEYNGHEGIGEATPLVGWTESPEECRRALDRAAAVADDLDWGVALGKLDAPAARHGIALALAEARAKRAGEPLYRTLGPVPGPDGGIGSHSDRGRVEQVPVNATVGADGTPEDTAARAREVVEAGYRCLKLKVGSRGVEADIERVRAVRNAVGEETALRVDANGAWTRTEAREAVEALAALDVDYVEQPLPTADLDVTADLRDRGVDIALDESLAALDVETVLGAEAADVLVLKPMVVGGPDLTVQAARRCRQAGVEPVVSTTVDAVVARTGAVHVAACIPGVVPCGLATGDRVVRDLAADPAPVENGSIRVPQAAGLGLPEAP
jgi:o-succinylbenzoate synthase